MLYARLFAASLSRFLPPRHASPITSELRRPTIPPLIPSSGGIPFFFSCDPAPVAAMLPRSAKQGRVDCTPDSSSSLSGPPGEIEASSFPHFLLLIRLDGVSNPYSCIAACSRQLRDSRPTMMQCGKLPCCFCR